MAICIVVPSRNNNYRGDSYSRFPIEVIYRLTNTKDDEQDLVFRKEFWSDTPGDTDAPVRTIFRDGREWKAWRWKENLCDWELV